MGKKNVPPFGGGFCIGQFRKIPKGFVRKEEMLSFQIMGEFFSCFLKKLKKRKGICIIESNSQNESEGGRKELMYESTYHRSNQRHRTGYGGHFVPHGHRPDHRQP